METKIVFLYPPEQWRYWRESQIVADTNAPDFERSRHTIVAPHAATMAYSIDMTTGKTVRVWWVWCDLSHIDGVDPPRELEKIPFEFCHPQRVKLNEPTGPWLPAKDPARLHSRLEKRPERLLRRFQEWEDRKSVV